MVVNVIRQSFHISKLFAVVPAVLRSTSLIRRSFVIQRFLPNNNFTRKFGQSTVFAGFLFGGSQKAVSNTQPKMSKVEEIIQKAEELYQANENAKLYEFLKESLQDPENQDPNVLWRMARCCREMANNAGDNGKKKAFTFEAFENSKKGVEKDPDNPDCNKWQGILLDLTARFEGTKKRIENSYLVKTHLEKAIEKRPEDAGTLHSLGVWCFEFADLPWYQKKLASAFFATPPESSYDEALKFFEAAEGFKPNFYSYNLVYLGKTHLRLGKKAEAKKFLQQCLDNPSTGPEDDEAKKEATSLLKKC